MTAARASFATAEVYQSAALLFDACSDRTRLQIMHALLDRELCTCDIAAALGATDSNVSQHLRILRALHLVRARRDGKFVFYQLDDSHVGSIVRMALSHLSHGDALQQAS